MRRPVESRAAIAEARKADPTAAGSYVAEGMLADQDNKAEAQGRLTQGRRPARRTPSRTTSSRSFSLRQPSKASKETFTAHIEKQSLSQGRRVQHAVSPPTYAWLGRVRTFSATPNAIGLIRRAIT